MVLYRPARVIASCHRRRAVGLSCLTLTIGRFSRDYRELRFKSTITPLPYGPTPNSHVVSIRSSPLPSRVQQSLTSRPACCLPLRSAGGGGGGHVRSVENGRRSHGLHRSGASPRHCSISLLAEALEGCSCLADSAKLYDGHNSFHQIRRILFLILQQRRASRAQVVLHRYLARRYRGTWPK